MTSGEGGSEPEGQQRPPQAGPPPGQPGPYGPPPGQGNPYGPPPGPYGPPPYGYAPMPSAAAGPPPPQQERPLAVRAGLGAFVGSIVLSLFSSLYAWANWGEFSDWLVAQDPSLQDPELAEAGVDPAAFAEVFATLFVVIGLLFTALYLLFVWFAWRGHNWSRIVLWVLGGLGVVSALSSLGVGGSPFPFLTGLAVFQLLMTLAGIVLLAARPANEWYASEKRRRALTP